MGFRWAIILLLGAASLGVAVLTPTATTSSLITSHVQVSGQVSCTTWPPALPYTTYLASRVRFQAANGEANDAQSFGLNFSVDANNVPADGENR